MAGDTRSASVGFETAGLGMLKQTESLEASENWFEGPMSKYATLVILGSSCFSTFSYGKGWSFRRNSSWQMLLCSRQGLDVRAPKRIPHDIRRFIFSEDRTRML